MTNEVYLAKINQVNLMFDNKKVASDKKVEKRGARIFLLLHDIITKRKKSK